MYLNFVEVEHLIEYLKERGINKIHADIEYFSDSPKGDFQVSTVVYYAILSARIEDYIAQAFTAIAQTTSVHISIPQERDEMRQRMFERFEQVVADLQTQGFTVERGVWSTQPHKLLSK